jgi:hypothetical protein
MVKRGVVNLRKGVVENENENKGCFYLEYKTRYLQKTKLKLCTFGSDKNF